MLYHILVVRILNSSSNFGYSFSNRCFWTKAISIWTSTGDADHAWIVGAYFHYVGGFEPPQVCIVEYLVHFLKR